MSIDVQNSLNDVIYRLGFADATDFGNAVSWVTSAELLQWADDAAKHLAWDVGVFLQYDTSVTVTPGTAVYSLPASHVFTLSAWLANAPLRVTAARDLWALDGSWPVTTGPSKRCSLDAGSVGTITLYPIPTAGGTLAQVTQEFPPDIVAGSTVIALPSILQVYFSDAMLAGARSKESDSAMLELAAHLQERMKMLEELMRHLWGPGQ